MSYKVRLPILHPGQVGAYRTPGRYKAVRCGRRWGKTAFGVTIAVDAAVKGEYVGWFTPDYKIQAESYNDILDLVLPVKLSSSKLDRVIRTITGGRIDFWTLENERAGRSRKYHKIIIDEAAFTKPEMIDIWEKSIQPTLLDYQGIAWVLSNTNGTDATNFFYRICNEPRYGFSVYHAPTMQNPLIPERLKGEGEVVYQLRRQEEFDRIKRENLPLVYQQEYLAEFVDWSGTAFFEKEKILYEGEPVEYPTRCDVVFATVDTAVKTGKDNDGTAVSFWARNKLVGHPLTLLDWDIVQLEGAMLEVWIPTILQRLEQFARECGARFGNAGVWIEDKSAGEILLQQARPKGLRVHPIDSRLTAMGKTERAIAASPYVYQGLVKISRHAWDKQSIFHQIHRNHWAAQFLEFRVGQENKEDDLLDTATYGIVIALGDGKGM